MTGSILHLDTAGTWRGGQQQVYLLHRELRRRGEPSTVLAPAGSPLLGRCREEELPARALPPSRSRWGAEVGRALRESGRCALLHVHDSRALTLGAVLRALRRDFRLVAHRRVSYPPGRNPLSRWKYRRPDAWIAVSGEIAGVLGRAGIPGGRVRVVHSALDLERFRGAAAAADPAALRASLEIHAEAPVVGFCAAFSPQKGHRVLVEAAEEVLRRRPDTVFLLPGEGRLRGDVVARVRDRGVEGAFRFPGFRADVAALTSLFAVGVVPSVEGEGSSASIKEPMALGVPVVASDLPGNREVLGGAGLSCPSGDPAALAREILSLLEDPDRARDLGRRGATRAEAFAPAAATDGALAVYRALREG